MALGDRWGTTSEEEASAFPCDRFLPDADQWWYRAIDVAAPAATTFRWLCQLRVAPYSYDWLDNRGRRSPRTLTPGLDDIAVGQRVMSIFTVIDVEPGRSLTIGYEPKLLGEGVVSYRVDPVSTDRSRLIVKVGVVYVQGIRGWLLRGTLPLGDLVMMRKQLRTLATLAERQHASGSTDVSER